MASMSHCALENTVIEMGQILELANQSEFNDSKYEKVAFDDLKRLCEEFIELTEGLGFEDFVSSY